MRAFLAGLALATATLGSAAQTTTPASPANALSSATPATSAPASTYRNDALHLSYTYPSSYTDASATVGPALEASMTHADSGAKDAMNCVTVPFSAMNNTGGQFALVLLAHADAACMKKKAFSAGDLAEFTHGEIQGLAASGAHTHFDEPVSFQTEGHPAQLLHGIFDLPTGQSLHALVVCMLLKPDVACWQFLASSEEALHSMAAFPVALEGAQPEPLVPPAVFARP